MKSICIFLALFYIVTAQYGLEMFSVNLDCSSTHRATYLQGCTPINKTNDYLTCSPFDRSIFTRRRCTTSDCRDGGFDCQSSTENSECRYRAPGVYSIKSCSGVELTGGTVHTWSGDSCSGSFGEYPSIYLTDNCFANGANSFRYSCSTEADSLTMTTYAGSTTCAGPGTPSVLATSTCSKINGRRVQLMSCGKKVFASSSTFVLSLGSILLGLIAFL